MLFDDFYKQLEDPFKDEELLFKMFKRNKSFKNEENLHLETVYSEDKSNEGINVEQENLLYAKLFDKWKKSLNTFNFNAFNNDNNDIKSFVNAYYDIYSTPKLTTKTAIEEEMLKYNFFNTYMGKAKNNNYENIMSNGFYTNFYLKDLQHKLYFNIEIKYMHEFLNVLTDKLDEKKLEYLIDYSKGQERDDTVILYVDDADLMDYINALEELKKDGKSIMNKLKKPYIITGNYDDWLGYGNEDGFSNENYEEKRIKLLKQAIDRSVYVYFNQDPDTCNSQGIKNYLFSYSPDSAIKYLIGEFPMYVSVITEEINIILGDYYLDNRISCFNRYTIERLQKNEKNNVYEEKRSLRR